MKESEHELDRALDVALGRILTPPPVPVEFRAKLQATLGRSETVDIAAVRFRLEQEQRQQLAEIKQQYVSVRRRTLGAMIGGAFAAGAGAAVALPWLTANLGPTAPLVVASAGAMIGFAIGLWSWLESRGRAAIEPRRI
jgi:hypothetical protein